MKNLQPNLETDILTRHMVARVDGRVWLALSKLLLRMRSGICYVVGVSLNLKVEETEQKASKL